MSKIILHIDLNAFFVNCEILKNPSLKGKPVIIGHQGRAGIVSTCSYEARKKGVSSGMPTFKAVKLCKDAIIIPVDFKFYKEKSKEFFNFVSKYAKTIQVASVDECYVDMTNELKNISNVELFLKNMQNELLKETGLSCSIGVAPTKFLAKMASDMKKPLGLTIIRKKDAKKILSPLPIDDFYGIGKKTTPKLKELGIKTIGDLIKLVDEDDPNLKNIFGKFYIYINNAINGTSDDVVSPEPFDPKSIGSSETLMFDTNNYDEIKNGLVSIAKEITEKLNEINKLTSTIQITLKDDNFKLMNRSKTLDKPTNKEEIIVDTVIRLLDSNYNENKMIRLIGVTLQNLVDQNDVQIQMSIFDNYEEIEQECATSLLVNELNRKMNKNVFIKASQIKKEKKHGIR